MSEENNKDWRELYKKDITSLKARDLSAYINSVKHYRLEKTHCSSVSANECNTLLLLAQSEQSSRAAKKIAAIAILISIVSIILQAT